MRLLLATSLLLILLGAARVLDPLAAGLTATHFSDTHWTSAPVRVQVDPEPSTDRLFAAWRGAPPDRFSTTWRGSVIVTRSATYTFAAESDDGSWVYVDGQLVVDNGGNHAARTASGSIRLDRGVHSIFIKYVQDGGDLAFQLRWGRDGAPPGALAAWALAPRSVEYSRFLFSVAIRRGLALAAWLWLAAAVVAVGAAAWRDVGAARPSVDLALTFAGAIVLLFVLPHDIIGDARARYLALSQLIEWGELSATAYSMVGPLFSAPLYLLGKVTLGSEWWCGRFNAIVFLAGVWAMARLLRGSVDDEVRAKFVLVLVGCSLFLYHLQGYYAEAFTAVLAGVGLLAVDRGYTAAGWIAATVGVVNTPASIAGLAAASGIQAWSTRRLRHLAPIAAAALGILVESWIRRGSPFLTGYEGNHGDATILTYSGRPGFSYPLFFGLLSILLSFGKGLLFYAPGLLLRVRGSRGFFWLWTAFLAGLVLVYAKWWAWFGGLFWGPRFFVVASLPASYAIASWLSQVRALTPSRRLMLWAVVTLTAWVAVDGVVFGYAGLGTCRDPNYEWLCLYVPEFSALWRPFVEWTSPSPRRLAVGVYVVVLYVWLSAPIVSALAADAREMVRVGRVSRGAGGNWRI